ncbi:MAG: bifunctional riboflavin kinase/FAD synthetase [Deltaproteobacteria bacterium]|nr:bifunctional riboflavin kinase/FAD synthetase [Deltaproteobacteria bacterium]
MAIIRLDDAQESKNLLEGGALAIGNFDGVHRGHQALLNAAREWSKTREKACGVLTFSPHPAQFLAKELAPKTLFNDDEKVAQLESFGVDVVVVQRFSSDFAAHSPQDFVTKVLGEQLKVGVVVVGEDFSFGKRGFGKVELLRKLLHARGVELLAIPPVREGNLICSSTKVREYIRSGNMPAAACILGRPYSLQGQVVSGDQRGRTLGFPTANIQCERELLPELGVYATFCILDDGRHIPSVTNLGLRPTFNGAGVRIEAHLLASPAPETKSGEADGDARFDEDLYGQMVRLEFVARIRAELRFSGKEELVAQVQRDVDKAQEILRDDAFLENHDCSHQAVEQKQGA